MDVSVIRALSCIQETGSALGRRHFLLCLLIVNCSAPHPREAAGLGWPKLARLSDPCQLPKADWTTALRTSELDNRWPHQRDHGRPYLNLAQPRLHFRARPRARPVLLPYLRLEESLSPSSSPQSAPSLSPALFVRPHSYLHPEIYLDTAYIARYEVGDRFVRRC
jgi:hypothetical protein